MATQALLEFIFIVFACITLLIGINAAKSKAAGRVLFPATFVTGIASISYFSMASGGGWVIAPDCRQLFVARYMDWLITTPLLLIDLGVVAGVSRWDIMALCLSDSACPHPPSYFLSLSHWYTRFRHCAARKQQGSHLVNASTPAAAAAGNVPHLALPESISSFSKGVLDMTHRAPPLCLAPPPVS